MKIFIFLFLFIFSFSVFAIEELSCREHFQKMYTTSKIKTALERNKSLCIEEFKTYLKNNTKCNNHIDNFCNTLTKSQIKVENYSYNPIKTMAMLQSGFLLGSSSTAAIINWISPPLEVPPPTTEKRKENATKKMTESECLYQGKAEGVVSFRYDASKKRCYVKECKKGYDKSSNHSICIFKAEKVCLEKNSDTNANISRHIVSWGYGRDLKESADCYISECENGWSVNTFGSKCEKDRSK